LNIPFVEPASIFYALSPPLQYGSYVATIPATSSRQTRIARENWTLRGRFPILP